MKKSMLIDAAHLEETRIVILQENAIEELDFESTTKNQNRGNIYLAKVSRVEPSLRAAFVDYGKDRHGFLPFSEIHPNYFQIPIADKEELLAGAVGSVKPKEKEKSSDDEDEVSFNEANNLKQASIRRSKLYSKYKIQEVIKKRQILLIQVSKEERGTKGAAITTFLSLAGRYCVLMPNSANSGGISKKIPYKIRKKMKDIITSLKVPNDMSIILRTAGSGRTKTEIKRDYEYLYKLWNSIKKRTLESIAPDLVHQENHIIKRAIRDNFSNDLSEIIIEGEDAYKLGKSFMKTLMPSKVSMVKKYKHNLPLFNHYDIEKDIELIFKSEVSLNSGGSIVITPTEALVSIDVNSGRSTTERDIEPTAVKTNLEAAKEIARQLRLRDLGGLIVIDFIDMNLRKNNHLVENAFKIAIKKDRAKIQIGRISSFGLLEMSRQRMRPSILEINFQTCSVCDGLGLTRSIESQSLQIIRNIESLIKGPGKKNINVEINPIMSEYILNYKNHFFSNTKNTEGSSVSISVNNNFENNKFNISFEEINITSDDEDDNTPKEKTKIKRKIKIKPKPSKKIVTRKPKKISKEIKSEENDNKKNQSKSNKPKEKKLVKKKIRVIKGKDDKEKDKKEIKETKIIAKKSKNDKLLKADKKVGWWQK